MIMSIDLLIFIQSCDVSNKIDSMVFLFPMMEVFQRASNEKSFGLDVEKDSLRKRPKY